MGYFNGVVDWSGPDYAAAAAADIAAERAANQTINEYAKALKNMKSIADEQAAKKMALRDQNRVFKQRGQITEKDQDEAIQRMENYANFVKKYGWKALAKMAREQTDRTKPVLP